jgi:hypothetical protein
MNSAAITIAWMMNSQDSTPPIRVTPYVAEKANSSNPK